MKITFYSRRYLLLSALLGATVLLTGSGCQQESAPAGRQLSADGKTIELDEEGYPVDGRPLQPAAYEPLGLEVDNFTLTDQTGAPFDTTQLAGDVWVANFFFTACPGPCLKLSQTIDRLHRDLGPEGVRFVSITVDPANDTPEQLQRYARQFAAQEKYWSFLTGTQAEVEHVATDIFRVPAEQQFHSEKLILVDPDGKIVGYYHGTDDAKVTQLKRKATQLLAERSKEAPSAEPEVAVPGETSAPDGTES